MRINNSNRKGQVVHRDILRKISELEHGWWIREIVLPLDAYNRKVSIQRHLANNILTRARLVDQRDCPSSRCQQQKN
jgi:hypothetical protein